MFHVIRATERRRSESSAGVMATHELPVLAATAPVC